MLTPVTPDLVGQRRTHAQAGLVNVDVVDHRIRSREVHVLENAGGVGRRRRALACGDQAIGGDEHRLPRLDIANEFKAQAVQRHAFRGDDEVRALGRFALAVHHGTDAMRIAKTDHAHTADHRHGRIGAAAALMDARDRLEHILGGQPQLVPFHQLVGKDVQQDFGVGIGVDVPAVLDEQLAFKQVGIGEVTVMRQCDTKRRIHVERLRLGAGVAAGRGIPHMGDAHVADQGFHVCL